MADDSINLELDRARTEALFGTLADVYIPLSVAAALVFHQAHGNTRAIVTQRDYDDALNMAAAALSRLIPIFTLRDPKAGRVALQIDLLVQRFARGATQVRGGGETIGELTVRRGELLSAISLVKRAGLPFRLALPGDP
jgi:hypothetical protein